MDDIALHEPALGELGPVLSDTRLKDWRVTLADADRRAATKTWAEAQALYADVIEQAPHCLDAYLGAARCARELGDADATLAALDAAAAFAPTHVGVQLERATALGRLGRDEAEAAAYRAVIALQPDHVAAHLGLGKNARRRGDRAACLAHFKAAAELAPQNPWPLLDIADECREHGRIEAAEAAYRQALALAPELVQALRGLGHCARARGDRAAALGQFQAAAALAPGDPGPWLEMADELRGSGRFAAAEDAYRAVLAAAPGHAAARRGLAHCARQRGDTAAALEHVSALAQARPDDQGAQLELAEALRAAGRIDAAEAVYEAILGADAKNVAARLGLAKCARLRGAPAAALAHLQAATGAAPENFWAWVDLGDLSRDLGRLDAAEDAYHRVLLIERGRVQAWIGLGHCARRRGARRQALAAFQAAILADASHPGAHLEAALELRELGLLDPAEQLCRDVLARDPGNTAARIALAQCAGRRGRRRESLALLRAAAADPANPAVALEIAADLRELGDLDGAAALCRAVAARLPDHAEAALGLGFVARAQGDRAAAAAQFRRAATLQPDHAGAWLELAFEQREAGDTAAAIATAEAVLQRLPDHLPALLSLGQSERQAGRHAPARAWFARAAAAHPGQPASLVELAVEERFAGNQARADALLAQALALDPLYVPAILRQAEHALLAFDAAAALAITREACAAQPGQTALRLGLAEALAALGEIEAAFAELAALEAEQGPLPAIRVKQLLLLRRDGDLFAAHALAVATAELYPRHFAVWMERLQAALLVGTEAAALLAAAPVGSQAEQAALHRGRGWVAERSWDLADARAHYAAAAALLPEDAGVQHDLLRVLVLTLDLSAARDALQEFCRLTAHSTRLQNKSLNVSQTHFGQIIDEYRLDESVGLAVTLSGLPAPDRARQLRRAVAEHPDSTALAVSLLVALRQDGVLAQWRPGVAGTIPPVIAQFWDTAPPPPDVLRLMATWPAHNPQHRVVRFDDAAAQRFLAERLPEDVLRAYRHVREPAQQADLFRLAWLAEHGGVYADADDRCIAKLATILPEHAELVLFQEELGTVANDFIAARPGHPLLRRALTLAVTAINRGDADVVWLSTGPGLLTRALGQWLPDWAADEPVALPPGLVVLDRHELFQAVATGCMTGYKKTQRHWSNSSFAGRRAATAAPASSPASSPAVSARS